MNLCLLTWEFFQWAIIHNPYNREYNREEESPGGQIVQGSVSHSTELMSEGYCKTHISNIRPPKLRPLCEFREQEDIIPLFQWTERLQQMHRV